MVRLSPCFKCFIHVKGQFREKKSVTSHREIFVTCNTQECDNVKTSYCPINCKYRQGSPQREWYFETRANAKSPGLYTVDALNALSGSL